MNLISEPWTSDPKPSSLCWDGQKLNLEKNSSKKSTSKTNCCHRVVHFRELKNKASRPLGNPSIMTRTMLALDTAKRHGKGPRQVWELVLHRSQVCFSHLILFHKLLQFLSDCSWSRFRLFVPFWSPTCSTVNCCWVIQKCAETHHNSNQTASKPDSYYCNPPTLQHEFIGFGGRN